MIDDIDVDDLAAMMVPMETPGHQLVNLPGKHKLDKRGNSDTEEEDARTEPASEGEAMETDIHPRPQANLKEWRLTRQVSSKLTPSYICETALTYVPQNAIAVIKVN